MLLDFDVHGRSVLIVGYPAYTRSAVRRFRAAGANVQTLDSPAGYNTSLLSSAVLVVAVDDGDRRWEPLAEACRFHGVPMVREKAAAPGGRVTLIGGGPGREDLLTTAAVEALKEADIVFYDRLAPCGNLEQLAPGAEYVDVGKRPGHHKVPQGRIEDLMVAAAKAGRNVARLKGGDPYVFGRGSEEVAACAAANVPVTVIPGVTSAVSVPAAAGIPVTARGVSTMFTVVSGHAPLSDTELGHLAGLGGTVVVLMGIGTLPQLTAGLRRAGMRPDMPMAVVERGYSPTQRTTCGTLADMVTRAGAAGCENPAVLVIGDVVRLRQESGLDCDGGLQSGEGGLAALLDGLPGDRMDLP